jgi:hypothetical protein
MINSYLSISSNGELFADIARIITDTNARFGANTLFTAANLPKCNKVTRHRAHHDNILC